MKTFANGQLDSTQHTVRYLEQTCHLEPPALVSVQTGTLKRPTQFNLE